MTYKVRWEKQAQADREGIYVFLNQEAGTEVANAADDRFISAVSLLTQSPDAGTDIGNAGERRKLVLTKFPFIIVYALKRKIREVHILRIVHTSRHIAARYRPR